MTVQEYIARLRYALLFNVAGIAAIYNVYLIQVRLIIHSV